MILYRTYVEDVSNDNFATERGFLHPNNRTQVNYCSWICKDHKFIFIQELP